MAYQGVKETFKTLLNTYKLTFDHDEATIELPITTKTANYTVLLTDSGHIFTNYGDNGAITFTLPTTVKKGFIALFVNAVAQTLTVAAGTADTLITFNDHEADSVALSTGSEQYGGAILVFCDGNKYYAMGIAVGHTYTVATA